MDTAQTFTVIAIIFLVMTIVLSCRWYVAKVSSEYMDNMIMNQVRIRREQQQNGTVYTIEPIEPGSNVRSTQPKPEYIYDLPPSYDEVVLKPYFRQDGPSVVITTTPTTTTTTTTTTTAATTTSVI